MTDQALDESSAAQNCYFYYLLPTLPKVLRILFQPVLLDLQQVCL